MVEDREQGEFGFGTQRFRKLQAALGKGVELHRVPKFPFPRGGEVVHRMEGFPQVGHHGPGGLRRQRTLLGQPKWAEKVKIEYFRGKHGAHPGNVRGNFRSLWHHHFPDPQAGDDPLKLPFVHLGDPKLAACGLAPREPHPPSFPAEPKEERVRFHLQALAFQDRARGEDPHHPAFEELLTRPWALELVTQGHLIALLQQPLDVGLAHRHSGHGMSVPLGKGDIEFPRYDLRVLKEGLVEIAEVEEEDGVGILGLGPMVLLHHRRKLRHRKSIATYHHAVGTPGLECGGRR